MSKSATQSTSTHRTGYKKLSPTPALVESDNNLMSMAQIANSVINEDGQALEYLQLNKGPDAAIWEKAIANDLGRLAQGVGSRMRSGTSTVLFIHRSKKPKHKKVNSFHPYNL